MYIDFINDLKYNLKAAWIYTLQQHGYRNWPQESYFKERLRLERNRHNLYELGDTINYSGELYKKVQ